ncbi:hypothetical protein E1A91_D06G252200v1 [Gossypium mustelinum]|uniref:CRIB domain-containing protein n=1 Tax=Gossypium mustelinum TaxID=34275 RepID=A0A5D2UNN7_GOSMU|nr:hypothetical protein E1A91_D06G252200v1 [Gossypium mustelinum]
MATKIKRLYKKFKNISRIFAVKEKKMEIGYPTDVKHVTHIGWGTPSHSTAPSSENEFNTRGSNFTSLSTWSSQDFEQSMGSESARDESKRSPASLGSSKCF